MSDKTATVIDRIIEGLKNDFNDTFKKLEEFKNRVGTNLDEHRVEDYYNGDLKIHVYSMEELADVFKILMKAGYNKPYPRGVEIGVTETTSFYKTETIYIVLHVPSDNIPEELIGDCEIKEIDIPEEVTPSRTKRVLVCNRDV
ncbi:MAG: hypothetical protein DRQ41_12620 [Gammaproteobacteria bacterium]|nr:MAG: hypothetical protein DRQ41_12620 [Gammaproteobacteria bacterium]